MAEQYDQKTDVKPLEDILKEAEAEEAFYKEVNKEKAKRLKKSNKSFDWKMFIKRFSQVGVGLAVFIGIGNVIVERFEDTKYAKEYAQKIETVNELPTGDNVVGNTLSNDFILNDHYYVLPCALQDLFNNGWTVEDYYEEKLNDNVDAYGTSLRLQNNGSKMYVTVESLTGKKTKVKDSYVTYLSINEGEVENIELSGNITFETTAEELKEFVDTLNEEVANFHEYDDYSYYSMHLDGDEDEPFNYSYSIYLEDRPGGIQKISEINISCYDNYLYQYNN